MSSTTALRGRLLSFTRAPEGVGDGGSYTYIDDGLIVIDHGRIAAVPVRRRGGFARRHGGRSLSRPL